MAGTLDRFADAAEKLLPKMSGLQPSESPVQRTAEAAGERLGEVWGEGRTLGSAADWRGDRDARGRTVASVSVDAPGVGMQGAGGAKTEGRMARVGKGFDPRSEPSEASPKPHPPRARDQAGLMGLEGLAARLRRHAAQVGRDRAEQRVVLTDGGTGLDDVMDIPFPHAERIRDSYHAAEHLGDLAKADGSGEAAAAEGLTGVGATGGRMRGGAAILATLEVWDLKGRSAATREAHRSVMGSVRKDLHRMDYPRNREEGWRIGSGPIEAACQTVVHQRPKRSGMRRGCDGADEACQLRAWDEGESGRWDALWERSLN